MPAALLGHLYVPASGLMLAVQLSSPGLAMAQGGLPLPPPPPAPAPAEPPSGVLASEEPLSLSLPLLPVKDASVEGLTSLSNLCTNGDIMSAAGTVVQGHVGAHHHAAADGQ